MRHISRLKTFLWYGGVGLLVSLAVLVSLARLSLDYADDYRAHLQELAGEYLGQPVNIGSMDARLVGLKPSFVLSDVALRDEVDGEPLARFSQIHISFNPLSSLRQLKPVLDLTLKGANLVVLQRKDGTFGLQGVASGRQLRQLDADSALGEWFLSQPRLAIEQSRITWRTQASGREMHFTDVNVELRNLIKRHRLNAVVKLPKSMGQGIRLSLDIQGDLLDRKEWAGQLYLKTDKVEPAQWLEGQALHGVQMAGGTVDVELWSSWRNGALQSLEGELALAELQLEHEGRALPLKSLQTRLRYLHDGNKWQLALADSLLEDGKNQGQPFQLEYSQEGDRQTVRGSALPLHWVGLLARFIPALSEEQQAQLQQMAPVGRLQRLRLELQGGRLDSAAATLQAVHFKPWRKLPGVEGLNARLALQQERVRLTFMDGPLSVSLPRLFNKPLHLARMRGSVVVQRYAETGWRLVSDGVELGNDDLTARLRLSLLQQPGTPPLADLAVDYRDARLVAVPDYLPVKIMPAATAAWLQHAFVGGRVERGGFILHGLLEKSLLRGQQGRFEALFRTDDAVLNYRDGWPRLEGLDTQTRITGHGLTVEAQAGRVYGSPLEKTQVRIDDFHNAVLEVDGAVRATAADGLRFMREAPLLGSAREALKAMQAEGAAPLRLQMSLPLSHRQKELASPNIKASVVFNNNRFTVTEGVVLSDLRGELSFSDWRFHADELAATLYEHPVTLTVFSEKGNVQQLGKTVVAMQGHASAEALRKSLQQPFLNQLSGESDWQASLNLAPGESGGASLEVHSSLDGMVLDLPSPFHKAAEGIRSTTLSLGLGGARSGNYWLRYGDLVSAAWKQQGGSDELERLAVSFGGTAVPALPDEPAIVLQGELVQFDWQAAVRLRRQLAANDTAGLPGLPLSLKMERLHLLPGETGQRGGFAELKTLPPIDISIAALAYRDMELGSLRLQAVPRSWGGDFSRIELSGESTVLSGEGRWRYGEDSRVNVRLRSDNMGKALTKLGYASVIKGGKISLEGEWRWPGSPLAVSLATLEGKGHVKVKEGTIEEIKPGAGKLFGLLSLQALPRRLFLDFSDIAKEGLQFSTIEGDIEIKDGNAFTDDLLLESLPADILISGRTGLVARDYDQLVVVVPNVSDTVSVAGALAWGPQVAAALIVLQRIFKSDIDAATMTRYRVTGSWDEPRVDKLKPLPLQGDESSE